MFPTLFLLLAILDGQAPAGDDVDSTLKQGQEAEVEEIIISGRRRTPGFLLSRSSLNLEDIPESQIGIARNVGDLMDQVPGVHLQRTSYGQVSPFLRGLTGFRTLALIDGIRLNNSTFRSGPNQYISLVDPWMLESAEIILGPGSVLHGSDAAGGLIHMTSRIPRPGDGLGESSSFLQRLSSAEKSSISRYEYSAVTDDHAIGFGFSYRDYGDFTAGGDEGEQPETGYQEWSGNFSWVQDLGDDFSFEIVAQSHRQEDVPRTHSTIFGSTWEGLTTGSDLQRDLDGERDLLYLRWQKKHGPESASRLTVSRQQIADEEDRVRSSGVRRLQGVTTEALGVSWDWFGYSDLGPLSSGVEWTHEGIDSFFRQYDSLGNLDSVRPRGPVADDSTYDWVGAYAQQVLEVSDDWTLNLGVRGTWAQVDAEKVDPDPSDTEVFDPVKEDWSSVVGSIRAIHDVDKDMRIYGGLSQAFRAPNLSDLTRFDAASSGDAEIPASDLDPEKFLTAEIGAIFETGSSEFESVIWVSSLDQLIVRFPTGDVNSDGDTIVTKANSGEGLAHGWDFRFRSELENDVLLTGAASWVTGDLETPVSPGVIEEAPLSRLAPTLVRLSLEKRFSDRFRLSGVVTTADRQDRLSPRDLSDTQRIPVGGTPGYVVLDLHATYLWHQDLEFFASLTNLTDEAYRIHGSGTNEPGANLILGFDIQF